MTYMLLLNCALKLVEEIIDHELFSPSLVLLKTPARNTELAWQGLSGTDNSSYQRSALGPILFVSFGRIWFEDNCNGKYVGHFKSSAHCACVASRMM